MTASQSPSQRDDSGLLPNRKRDGNSKPSLLPAPGSQASHRRRLLFPCGEGRKWGTWKTYCQLIHDALGHPEDGSQGPPVPVTGVASRRQKFHSVGWDTEAILPEATSTAREEARTGGRLTLRNLDGFWRTCVSFPPLEQPDCSVLVYINIGRRLANLPMNHSCRHFLPRGRQISKTKLPSENTLHLLGCPSYPFALFCPILCLHVRVIRRQVPASHPQKEASYPIGWGVGGCTARLPPKWSALRQPLGMLSLTTRSNRG